MKKIGIGLLVVCGVLSTSAMARKVFVPERMTEAQQETYCAKQSAPAVQPSDFCITREAKKTERNVDQLYKNIVGSLMGGPLGTQSKQRLDALSLSQRTWSAYRDAQCALDRTVRGSDGGPVFVYQDCRLKQAQEREQALRATFVANGVRS